MLNRILNLFRCVIVGRPGDPYMLRWHILPRNRFFNIYLHKFLRNDDDRALHDHPWSSVSILLSGEYIEQTDKGRKKFSAGSIIHRHPGYRHRIELIQGKPVWTLFITGPKVRTWGFWCPKGFVPWFEFVDMENTGFVGKGCD